jgi:hypothetical protein
MTTEFAMLTIIAAGIALYCAHLAMTTRRLRRELKQQWEFREMDRKDMVTLCEFRGLGVMSVQDILRLKQAASTANRERESLRADAESLKDAVKMANHRALVAENKALALETELRKYQGTRDPRTGKYVKAK